MTTPKAHPSQYEGHPRIANLAKMVRGRLKIRYRPSDKGGWGAVIKGGRLDIAYSDSEYPISCLAHELLHAELQLLGYRRLKISFTAHSDNAMFNRLMTALDNELQHHRMFPRFVNLGCPPGEFYDDAETDTKDFLNERLSENSSSLISLVPDFLTVLAPGGDLAVADRDELVQKFYTYGGGEYRVQFEVIRQALSEWSGAATLNSEETVRKICRTLYSDPPLMWFGYSESERPPNAGFFVGQRFETA